ncbi:hypothetical protein M514_10418 [Trichuris suis]|uniref:Cystatin domain-containing protein n=1 Tax=Trichuris suis TaxID=68888 RepID=A0A085NIJ9_9BILA|nr:hypothetical protein M514_10418 [Trichuris suis]
MLPRQFVLKMLLFALVGSLLIAQATCSRMVGAHESVGNPDDDEAIVGIANHVIDNINAENPNKSPFVLVQVLEATRQLVAGLLYRVTFAAGEARCHSRKQKKYNVRRERCWLLRSGEMRIYKAEVLEVPWQKPPRLVMGKNITYSFHYSSK